MGPLNAFNLTTCTYNWSSKFRTMSREHVFDELMINYNRLSKKYRILLELSVSHGIEEYTMKLKESDPKRIAEGMNTSQRSRRALHKEMLVDVPSKLWVERVLKRGDRLEDK